MPNWPSVLRPLSALALATPLLFCLAPYAAIAATVADASPPAPRPPVPVLLAGTCPDGIDIARPQADLPHAAAALASGKGLDILAIGSASTVSPKGAVETSFPYRMAAALRAVAPAAEIDVTVNSTRGKTAADMLAELPKALSARHYALVLWQTGTIEAVRNLPPDEFFQTLQAGAELVRDAHADLILIDPQYSRFLRANANLDPYLQVMQVAGGLPDAALLPRYDLMHDWVDSGAIDMERAAHGDRARVAAELHDCLGRALASMVVGNLPRPEESGAKSPPRPLPPPIAASSPGVTHSSQVP